MPDPKHRLCGIAVSFLLPLLGSAAVPAQQLSTHEAVFFMQPIAAGAQYVFGRSLEGGAALTTGPSGDFSAVYPSAQAGIDLMFGRWRIGSHARVIRVAGANRTGDYWTAWLPIRIGYALQR